MIYLAGNLKILRAKHFLSQEKFAEKLGIMRGTLASYESNRSEPSVSSLARICKILNISMDDMLSKDLSKI